MSSKITSPRFDLILMLAIAWCLMDMGALVIGQGDHPALGLAFALAILGSLFLAWQAWRRAKNNPPSVHQ